MSTNEDAVHRSSGWCSVNLFRVSRRRGARTPPLYLMYPDSIRILPGCRRVSLTVAVVLTSPYSRMCPLLMTLAAPVKVAPAAGCAHTRPRVTAQTQRAAIGSGIQLTPPAGKNVMVSRSPTHQSGPAPTAQNRNDAVAEALCEPGRHTHVPHAHVRALAHNNTASPPTRRDEASEDSGRSEWPS